MIRRIADFILAALVVSGCEAPERRGRLPVRPLGASAAEAPMVLVPAGAFLMGTERGGGGGDEPDPAAPARRVYLDAFFIDKHEVTNGDYAAFLAATGRPVPRWRPGDSPGRADWSRFSWRKRTPEPGAADLPVSLVSWFDAEAYCIWVRKRLPTEAEWEKAARGTDGGVYPWGNGPPGRKANYGKRYEGPLPAGSLPEGASPYGALDMAGNLAEWTADYYDPKYYARAPGRNPRGPAAGYLRVVRGGHWRSEAAGIRTYRRGGARPTQKHGAVGFRCARSAPAGRGGGKR